MTPLVIGLTLVAAVLHATWNALLRSGVDRLWSITVMSFATTAASVPFALLLPKPAAASWFYLGISALLQVAYSILLANAYRFGELGQVYPILRGSVPLFVTLGAFVLAGQTPGGTALLGIALISFGIASLAFGRERAAAQSVAFAVATAAFVASYVTADGIGVRLAGNAQSYAAWIFLVYGALMPAAFLAFRRRMSVSAGAPETVKALTAGLISLGSYGLILTAFARGNVGPIAALRETSIVFSAVIGRLVLGEALTARRLLVCVIVAIGAVCIGYTP